MAIATAAGSGVSDALTSRLRTWLEGFGRSVVCGLIGGGPKALCELQGYVYAAWVRMAEVFDALDKPERAQVLRAPKHALFARFNEAFWDEIGFYAYALDGDKRRC
jgi:glycogen debranching enzyme